uniref:Uncharacterized protein n=1 Tax=Spongospora subterranea TaxID=70186 RepID=A0A0H5QMQ6_9EUKA|eukprot:CRZ02681.1 hypothetical protein [Spongospora subterranea]
MTPSDSSSSSLLSPASDRDSLFHDLVTYRLASSSPPPNSHLFPSTPSASFRLLRRLDPSSHDDITPRPPLPPKSPVAHGQQYFYSRARQIRQPIEQQDELKSNPDSNCSEEPFPCNMIECRSPHHSGISTFELMVSE